MSCETSGVGGVHPGRGKGLCKGPKATPGRAEEDKEDGEAGQVGRSARAGERK